MSDYQYFSIEQQEHVSVITFSRPPQNFFNAAVIYELLDILAEHDQRDEVRATVLCSEGTVFCAGGEFGKGEAGSDEYISMASDLYGAAMNLFRVKKPIIAAVQGAAVGGGLGLALVADFRVTCESAKFCANFNRLGIHPGFGSSITLPRVVGSQAAQMMVYTGRRINGAEAFRIGLADQLVEEGQVKQAAIELATEIAISAPQAVQDTRETFRRGLADEIANINKQELEIQKRHMRTADFIEGVTATAERRAPVFSGG